MSEELKPCPFCGGEACIEDISEPDDMDAIWMIVCDECGGAYICSTTWARTCRTSLKK